MPRHLRQLLAEGRLPECWIPPPQILECRALLETYHDLRRERTAWAQRIHAVFFHQGVPPLGEGALRTEAGIAGLCAAAAAHLSPAGQLQVATALDMLTVLDGRLHVLRHQLLHAARQLTGKADIASSSCGRRLRSARPPRTPPILQAGLGDVASRPGGGAPGYGLSSMTRP